jgi:hypothetical protein
MILSFEIDVPSKQLGLVISEIIRYIERIVYRVAESRKKKLLLCARGHVCRAALR